MPKRKVLNLKEKMEIIMEHDNQNLSVREIAKRFKIGKSQAATIIKEKPKIKLLCQSGDYNLNTKRTYLNEKGKQLDKMCLDWFSEVRRQNIPINGPTIQAKAKEIATDLGMTRFVASNGWLHKWRNRHNITYESTSGEASTLNQYDEEQLFEHFEYKSNDIFEAEESKPSLSNETPEISDQKEMLSVSLVLEEPPLVVDRPRSFGSRKVLNLKEKIEIINEHNKTNLSVREIAKRFNIGKSQAATIIKEKPRIASMWHSGEDNLGIRRSQLNVKRQKLDQICHDWFLKARNQNIPISAPEIQAKAKEIAASVGIPGFLASNGWLQKWCKRRNITLKSLSGETAAITQDSSSHAEYIIPTDLIKTSDSDNEHTSEVEDMDEDSWTISSNETALMAISKLKQFLQNDHEAFEHLHNLENHLLNRIFNDKVETSS